jgi:cytochrome c553
MIIIPRGIGLSAVVLSVAAAIVVPGVAAESGMPAKPDEAHGKQIATHGVGNEVPPCSRCHGETGIGDGSGAFPRLTGQLPSYLYQQLRSFADGTRPNPVMSPIAKGLSDRDMGDVAGYYAAQQGPYFPQPFVDQAVLELGGRLAAVGQARAGIPACVTCHGEAGKGSAPLFPYLAGQYRSYLAQQLRDFKSGTRRNDPMAVMPVIASKLNEGDIAAVSAYFASVRPPCQCSETTSRAGAATASGTSPPPAAGSGSISGASGSTDKAETGSGGH